MGNFSKGIKHGQGILIEKDRKIYGIWEKGLLLSVRFVEKDDGSVFSAKI